MEKRSVEEAKEKEKETKEEEVENLIEEKEVIEVKTIAEGKALTEKKATLVEGGKKIIQNVNTPVSNPTKWVTIGASPAVTSAGRTSHILPSPGTSPTTTSVPITHEPG